MLAAQSTPIIVDTDCGRDDLMAIAFLLARPDVRIEAVTVANGLAHVQPGAANILRLLELGGKGGTSVYMGRETPLRDKAAFPEACARIPMSCSAALPRNTNRRN